MTKSAYQKLGDLAEQAMTDPSLLAALKSGDEATIRRELTARLFTAADIDKLIKAGRAVAPKDLSVQAKAFWIW